MAFSGNLIYGHQHGFRQTERPKALVITVTTDINIAIDRITDQGHQQNHQLQHGPWVPSWSWVSMMILESKGCFLGRDLILSFFYLTTIHVDPEVYILNKNLFLQFWKFIHLNLQRRKKQMEMVPVKLTHSSGKIEHLPIRAYLDEETSSFSHWLLGSPDVCFILFLVLHHYSPWNWPRVLNTNIITREILTFPSRKLFKCRYQNTEIKLPFSVKWILPVIY